MILSILGFIFFWCIHNLSSFRAFKIWMRPELYGPDGEATLLKTAVFQIVPAYYKSFLNVLLGLGPGHTVGRMGGWMLREYSSLLSPLGSTRHPASPTVWLVVANSWLGTQSSMFSPLFSWAGIWGDFGLIGLGIYLYLLFVVWRYLCIDDFCKLLLLSIFVTGFIFSQLEEPGYMLSSMMMIGLRWQAKQIESASSGHY